MKRLSVFWHIFLATMLLLICTFIVTGLYVAGTLKAFYYNQVEKDLRSRALLIQEPVASMMEQPDHSKLRSFCRSAGRRSATRITVIDRTGRVLADSNEDPEIMELHDTRPEFIKALSGHTGSSIRYSHTLHRDMLYVAIPIYASNPPDPHQNNIIGALRLSLPLTVAEETLWSIEGRYALAGMVILVAALLGGLFISSRLSRPLELMKEAAEKIARGEPAEIHPMDSSLFLSLEVATLSDAMNRMAQEIRERISTIEHNRAELELVFCALKEAVIVLDKNKRIVRMNRAAAELFSVPRDPSIGKQFAEITRDPQLNQTLDRVVRDGEPEEIELFCHTGEGERFLNARFAILHHASGDDAGILIVISDLTEIKRLENIRKEFVANVSHELKTPVTSIRGYAEVLMEGDIDNKEETRRFVEIIVRQAGRLQAVVEDLLSLSRIEQDAMKGSIRLEPVKVSEILASVRDMCQIRAGDKEIKLIINTLDGLEIVANPALLVQAVSNLVINAIKYSDPGSTVLIDVSIGEGEEGKKEVVFSVKDQGCGISPEHLPRIFERFYRSDKARSRKLGGTGLGLAIVKHIAKVHGGRAEVESEVGVGSEFRIVIPADGTAAVRRGEICGLPA